MNASAKLSLSLILLGAVLLSSGCASKSELQARQSQMFQARMEAQGQNSAAEQSILVKTSEGDVSISPTVVGYSTEQFDDPLESINRPIFAFNHALYTWILNPLADGYTAIMPDPVEDGVSRFFGNLREPLNAINHLFQANGSEMGSSVGRFLINSTIGLLGIFDPAEAWFGIEPAPSTLNDTMTSWDVGYGAYIVLPILGQSDVRNGVSTLTEATFAPVKVVTDPPQTQYLQTYDGFHEFAPRASSYEELYQQSEDPYAFFRNMYMQSILRDKQFAAEDESQQEQDKSENATEQPVSENNDGDKQDEQ